MSDEGEIGASPRAAAGVLPCSRLEASRVSKGDKVILLAGERREDIDGKWGIVKQVIERRLAVVTCKASNKGLYPPSYTETEIVVPLSCAFDLNDASARSEFICQCINRSLNLHGLLSSKFGVSGDMMEIYLHIAKHLVRYCQSLLVFSGYRQKIYSSVFCRHWDKRKNYWVSAAKLPSPRIDCGKNALLPSPPSLSGNLIGLNWIRLDRILDRNLLLCFVSFLLTNFFFGGLCFSGHVASSWSDCLRGRYR